MLSGSTLSLTESEMKSPNGINHTQTMKYAQQATGIQNKPVMTVRPRLGW